MKEYKLVNFNVDFKWSKSYETALKKVEDIINEYVSSGWTLQQIVSHEMPGDMLFGVFWRER